MQSDSFSQSFEVTVEENSGLRSVGCVPSKKGGWLKSPWIGQDYQKDLNKFLALSKPYF